MSDLDALRHEIQTDRIEIQRTILEGFIKLALKFDEHAVSDNDRFEEMNEKITVLETKYATITKAIGALVLTLLAAVIQFILSMFKH